MRSPRAAPRGPFQVTRPSPPPSGLHRLHQRAVERRRPPAAATIFPRPPRRPAPSAGRRPPPRPRPRSGSACSMFAAPPSRPDACSQSRSSVSASSPMIAAIAPGLSSWIAAMSRPRSHTRRIPSSAPRAPAATAAVYSPRLCPATKSGRSPVSRATSSTAMERANSAGWATSVRVSDSIGPSSVYSRDRQARELVGAAQVALGAGRGALAQVGSHPHLLRALPGVQKREFAHGAGTLTEPRSAVIPAGVRLSSP